MTIQGKDPVKMFRKHVSSMVGVRIGLGDTMEEAVKRVTEDLRKATGRPFTERRIRDLFSGYGIPREPKKRPSVQPAKREARLVSLMEDMEKAIEEGAVESKSLTLKQVDALERQVAGLSEDLPSDIYNRLSERANAIRQKFLEAKKARLKKQYSRVATPLPPQGD